MRKLRILNTVEFYYPSVGGAQNVVREISERLAKRGHEIVVATSYLEDRNFSDLNGVKIEQFALTGSIVKGTQSTKPSVQMKAEFDRYLAFIGTGKFDVMFNYAAQQWATDCALISVMKKEAARVNIMATCGFSGMIDIDTVRGEYKKYFEALLPPALNSYDALVFHSAIYQDYEYCRRLGLKHMNVIPNAIDPEEFLSKPSIDFREKYGITTPYLLLCVGNFIDMKGQQEVVKMLRKMKRNDVTLVLIGKNYGTLDRVVVEALGLPVKFLVDVPRSETLAAYHSADLFLFCSEVEASPMVILEAQAASTPFVSLECGNVRQYCGGVVCSKEEFPQRANELLDNQTLRLQLAEKGHAECMQNFTWDVIIDQYEQLYYRCLEQKVGV